MGLTGRDAGRPFFVGGWVFLEIFTVKVEIFLKKSKLFQLYWKLFVSLQKLYNRTWTRTSL